MNPLKSPIVSLGIAAAVVILATSVSGPISTAVKNHLPPAKPVTAVTIPQELVLLLPGGGSLDCDRSGRVYVCRVPQPHDARSGPRS